MVEAPTRIVTSRDGTPIALFETGGGRPVILVHGAAADHTTWRTSGPVLAEWGTIHAIDRRGRGASGDREPYDIEREFEDVVAVAEAVAAVAREPVAVVGHSFGGRVALGAALRTRAIRAVVSYEGAPAAPGHAYRPTSAIATLEGLAVEGRREELLVTFLRDVVGMDEVELEAYRANPVWPNRVAAADTIVREVRSDASPAANLDALGQVRTPVLQVLGGDSPVVFRLATEALGLRLPRGRTVTIEGARHGAHHTHAPRFVAEVVAFLESMEPAAPTEGRNAWTSSAG